MQGVNDKKMLLEQSGKKSKTTGEGEGDRDKEREKNTDLKIPEKIQNFPNRRQGTFKSVQRRRES